MKSILCFCPECHEESLDVTVTDSGSGFNGEITIHWFEGDGECTECGWKGPHQDSSD